MNVSEKHNKIKNYKNHILKIYKGALYYANSTVFYLLYEQALVTFSSLYYIILFFR